MKSFHIPKAVLFLLLFVLVVFVVLYRPIDIKGLLRASSQGTVRTEELRAPGSSTNMDLTLLSPDDAKYQQLTEVLSTVSCRKKFDQVYSHYSHDYPVQAVTASFYDDAENHKLLLTVYSDGVCIVNSAYVTVNYPGGGAEALFQELWEIFGE